MFDFSNFSHEEYYKINGNLSPKRIEDILDKQANLPAHEALNTVRGEIQESQVCGIGEDILTDIITDVEYLVKWCKGENKSVAMNLLEKLRQMEIHVQSTLEYHNEKVASAIECLDNIQGQVRLITKQRRKTIVVVSIPALTTAFDDCKWLSLIQKTDNRKLMRLFQKMPNQKC